VRHHQMRVCIRLIIFAFWILQLPAQSDSQQPIIEACYVTDGDPMPGGGLEDRSCAPL
jgi:hypothetical protein